VAGRFLKVPKKALAVRVCDFRCLKKSLNLLSLGILQLNLKEKNKIIGIVKGWPLTLGGAGG